MKNQKSIVVTNGCFDILHVGHIKLLQHAKQFGDILVVLVNSDDSIARLKGPTRPINSVSDRIQMLEAIRWVDKVIVFEEDTPLSIIHSLRPDVLVKGGDYEEDNIVGAEYVKSYGGKIEIVPLVVGSSTTNIINKLK